MDKKMTLEQANDLLEQALRQLENEALPMSESVALYARACELMAFCMEALEGYKGKIEQAGAGLARYMTEEPDE